MKKLVIIIFFIALSMNLMAQVDYSFGNIKQKKRERGVIPTLGIKVGLTSYHVHFAYKDYNRLPDDIVLKPAFGIFVEYPVKKLRGISIAGEVLMIERGYRKSFKFRGDMPEVDEIKANYLDFRIPITYYFMTTKDLNPYIFVAPDFGLCYGGTMSKTFSDNKNYNVSVDLSKSNAVTSYDVSVAAGIGVRYTAHFQLFAMVFKLDGSYNFGLLNTNGATEPVYTDHLSYHVDDDSRTNRGFEIMLSVGIPLKFNTQHDSCWGWR